MRGNFEQPVHVQVKSIDSSCQGCNKKYFSCILFLSIHNKKKMYLFLKLPRKLQRLPLIHFSTYFCYRITTKWENKHLLLPKRLWIDAPFPRVSAFCQCCCVLFVFFRRRASQGLTMWGASCVRGQIWMTMSNLAAKLRGRLFKMSAAPSVNSSWLKPSKSFYKAWTWGKCFQR